MYRNVLLRRYHPCVNYVKMQKCRSFTSWFSNRHDIKDLDFQEPAVALHPKEPVQHQSTIIWLHGLGDNHENFSNLMKQIIPSSTRCVVPDAPNRPISINSGAVSRGWYDIRSLNRLSEFEDKEGIFESKKLLEGLIKSEVELLNGRSDRLIIGGFSQGGAMAALCGLTQEEKIAALFVCSGYIVLQHLYETHWKVHQKNKNTYTLFCHGDNDGVVPHYLAESGALFLQERGSMTNVHVQTEENLGHEMSLNQIVLLANKFHEILANEQDLIDKEEAWKEYQQKMSPSS